MEELKREKANRGKVVLEDNMPGFSFKHENVDDKVFRDEFDLVSISSNRLVSIRSKTLTDTKIIEYIRKNGEIKI